MSNYSTATTSLSIGLAIFVVPHLIAGLILLSRAAKGISIFASKPLTKSRRVIEFAMGLIFFGASSGSIVAKTWETHSCRNAAKSLPLQSIRGPISIQGRSGKPGSTKIEFSIGERHFRTVQTGLECDCGYLTPVGKVIRLKDGMFAAAKVADGYIIELSVDESE